MATHIYASSNDDRFPGIAWDQALRPYLAKARGHNDKVFLEEVFDCPLLTREGKHYGYALNWAVMNKPASSFKKPEETIVFFETDALGPGVVANLQPRNHVRHGRGDEQLSCVGRADGTAKVIQ